MGISLSVLRVTDAQIRDFEQHPEQADELCNTLIPFGDDDACCRLFTNWKDLHRLLTRGNNEAALPFCALERGDVRFRPTSDPTWALYSATASALADVLTGLTEDKILEISEPWRRTYVEKIARAKEAGTTAYRDADPEALWDDYLRELMQYAFRFRDFAQAAAREQKGLLFCRYEDW